MQVRRRASDLGPELLYPPIKRKTPAQSAETTFVDGRRRGKRRQTLQLKEHIVYQAKGLVCDTAGIHEFGTDIEAGDRRPDKVCTSAEFLIVRNAEDVAESRPSHVRIVADPHH